MKNGTLIAGIIIVVILIGGAAVFAYHGANTQMTSTSTSTDGAMTHDDMATTSMMHEDMTASTSSDHMMASTSADAIMHKGDAMIKN
jgi:hypothetical protein